MNKSLGNWKSLYKLVGWVALTPHCVLAGYDGHSFRARFPAYEGD